MPLIANETECAAPGRSVPWTVLLWTSLVPLMLLLRPYAGLVHDARIYIGRGLADRDPAGLGRDLMFANEPQTAFSAFRVIVDALLSVADPGRISMGIVAVGSLTWLGAAILLARRLTGTRVAWAAVLAILALPGDYGPLHIFGYAEAIATPRLFAEAVVLVGLERMLAHRRLAALAFLTLALAIHPLMALPGLALAAILLVHDDLRWFGPVAALAAAMLAAAWLGVPLLGRLFVPMDPDWLAVVRMRNANLFPTLWPAEAFAQIGCQAAAAIVAGDLAGPPGLRAGAGGRVFLWGGAAVGLAGLFLSLGFGDVLPSVLLLQLQTWRALWLLSVLGNAGLVMAAVGLWRRGGASSQLVLALLIFAFASQAAPALALGLAAAAVLCRLAQARGRLQELTPWIGRLCLVAALAVAAVGTIAAARGLASLLVAPGADWHDVPAWPYVVASGILAVPLVTVAVAVAVAPAAWLGSVAGRSAALVATLVACVAAVQVWDSRDAERRMVDGRLGADALAADLGPGEGGLLWVDDDSETWFLARRPAVFNPVQGAPILFSRPLALEWAARGRRLAALGLVRPGDLAVAPADMARDPAVTLTPAGLRAFCRDAARPAGLVVPGDRRAAVPEDMSARLWIPPTPIRRLSIGEEGATWRSIVDFTVVSCSPPAPSRDGGRGEMQSFG